MGYNGVKPPMPQLRLPADYLYNPLYFAPNSNVTPEHGIGESDVVASGHRVSHAVLPSSTYVHRSLHFEASSLNVTPVRSHHHWSGGREKGPARRSGGSSPAAASAQGGRNLSPTAYAKKSLRGRGHVSSQEVTVDATIAGLDTSLPRSTRATQLRTEYVHHHMEERDEAAQNIFFLSKGRPLSAAALSSPRGQHRTSSISASCSSILVPARQHSSGAASSRTLRFTKAAQLRQRAAAQRIEKLEREELEKTAELELVQAAVESTSRQASMPLKTAHRGKSSLRADAAERSGGAHDAAGATSSSGVHPSHCIPHWQTSRTGSSADAIDHASQRIRTTRKSASMRSSPREDRWDGVSLYADRREKTVDVQQRVAEETHAPSADAALDAPVPLSTSKHRLRKLSDAAVKALCREATDAKFSDGIVVAPTPAARDKSERLPSRHHRHCRSHTSPCDADNLSPVAIREVRDTGDHTSATAAAAAVLPGRDAGVTPASQMTETEMTPNEDISQVQCTAPSKSSHLQDNDANSSSSVSSIMFTVGSVAREDSTGGHYPEVRHDREQFSAQSIPLHHARDDEDGNISKLRKTGRGACEHSPSFLAFSVPAVAASGSGVRVTVSPLIASPVVPCLSSPRNATASVVRDEVRIDSAAAATPAKEKADISSVRRHSERSPHTAGVNESVPPEHSLESALQDTLEAPSGSSAGALGRHTTSPPSVDAPPAQAHAPTPTSAEHPGDVNLMPESPLQDFQHTGSSAKRMSGEMRAQPPSRSERTDWSAQVVITPLPQPERRGVSEGEIERAPAVAEEEQLDSFTLSAQSSFLSIASYHAEESAQASALVCDGQDRVPNAVALQAELLRHYRTAESSCAAVESHLESCTDLTPRLRSHLRALSDGEGAIKVVDERQASLGHDGAPRPSSWLLWNASRDNASALCGFVSAAASGESDLSRSVAADLSQMVAGGSLDMPHGWGLPVPPTNYSHAAAAWEARRRAVSAANLDHSSTTLEQPRQVLCELVSGSRARRRGSATADATPTCPPRMEAPVRKEAVNSRRLPNLQESGRRESAAPSAIVALSVAVAASAENDMKASGRPEVVREAAVLGDAKTTDDAADAAVLSDAAAAPRRCRKCSGDFPPVPKKDARRGDTDLPRAAVTVTVEPPKPLSCLEGAKQMAAVASVMAERSAMNDAPRPQDSFSPSKRFALSEKGRPAEQAVGVLAANGNSVRPPNRAESIDLVQDTSQSSPGGTADRRALDSVSSSHPLTRTLAETHAAKEEGVQDAVVSRGAAEDAPALRFAKSRGDESPVQMCEQLKEACVISVSAAAAQKEDVTSSSSHSSSTGVAGLDSSEILSASLPLSARRRTPDRAFFTASTLLTEHGSFSLHAIEAEKSPLERSVHARHAASLSSGGGEEELAEGEPHSHAPTPLQCRLLQRKMRATPPREVEHVATAAEEERKCGAPLAQAFSRTDASTRCLSAAAVESEAARHAGKHTSARAVETPKMPFSDSARRCSAAGKQNRREGVRVMTVNGNATLDKVLPSSAGVTFELALPSAPCLHNSPGHSRSSSASHGRHSLASSTSSSLWHSSLVTTPSVTNRSVSNSPGRLNVPQQVCRSGVTAEWEVDEDCGRASTGDAVAANPNSLFSSASCESPEHAAPVKLTEATPTGAAVITTPYQSRFPESGSECNATHSPISEHIACGAGVWVDRVRSSASPDYAEASVTERCLEVLRGQVRSAPTVPLTRETYFNNNM